MLKMEFHGFHSVGIDPTLAGIVSRHEEPVPDIRYFVSDEPGVESLIPILLVLFQHFVKFVHRSTIDQSLKQGEVQTKQYFSQRECTTQISVAYQTNGKNL